MREGEGEGGGGVARFAGHENKIKFPISSASLLGLSRQKAAANFANNTAQCSCNSAGEGKGVGVSVLGVACNTHVCIICR